MGLMFTNLTNYGAPPCCFHHLLLRLQDSEKKWPKSVSNLQQLLQFWKPPCVLAMKNAKWPPATHWDFTMQNGGLTPSRCWKPQARMLKTLIFRGIFIYIYIYTIIYIYKYAGLNRSLPLLGPKNSSKPVVKSTLHPPKWMVDTYSTTPKLVDVAAFCRKSWSHKNPIATCHKTNKKSLRKTPPSPGSGMALPARTWFGSVVPNQGVYQWCQVGVSLLLRILCLMILYIMTNYTYIMTIFFVANYYIMTNID